MDRNAELEAFKGINLSLIASAHGYEVDRKKSTRHSVLMAGRGDKIIISQNGGHYIFCSTTDPSSSGTAIDFVQHVVERGCSLGRVRQILRPFLSGGYTQDLQATYRGKYVSEIKPSEADLLGVAVRYSKFEPITEKHKYLCDTRGIPFELVSSPRLEGRIRHSKKYGSIVFPHWGSPDGTESRDRCLTGYEIKSPTMNLFSKGGRKGMWASAGFETDRTLSFAESGLDALSYLAEHRDRTDIRIASLSGQLNPSQPALIRSAIEKMPEGSTVVAAFDNDPAGDRLTEKLQTIVSEMDRKGIEFKDDRPLKRGYDWNKVLMERLGRTQGLSLAFPSMGR